MAGRYFEELYGLFCSFLLGGSLIKTRGNVQVYPNYHNQCFFHIAIKSDKKVL